MKRRARLLLFCSVIALVVFSCSYVTAQGPDTGPYHPVMTLGRGMVRSVVWSPQGDVIAVGGALGIWLYTPDFEDIGLLTGHTKAVYGLAFSPDGTKLASGSHDMTVRVWDVATQKELLKFEGHTGLVVTVAWSPDPDWPYVISGSYDGTVRLWNFQTGMAGRVLSNAKCGQGWVTQVALTPDSHSIVSSNLDGMICLWDRSGGVSKVLEGTPENWAQATGQPEAAFTGEGVVDQAQDWSPDGTRVAVADWDSMVWMADAVTGEIVANQPAHADWLSAVGWIQDGSNVTANDVDGRLMIWEAATGRLQLSSSGHMEPVPLPATTPDGSRQVTLDGGGTVRIVDAAGSVIAELPGLANAAAWSPDGTRLAVANRNGTITIWAEQ